MWTVPPAGPVGPDETVNRSPLSASPLTEVAVASTRADDDGLVAGAVGAVAIENGLMLLLLKFLLPGGGVATQKALLDLATNSTEVAVRSRRSRRGKRQQQGLIVVSVCILCNLICQLLLCGVVWY